MRATNRTIATGPEITVVGLNLRIPARLDLGRVPAALGQPDAPWLGQRCPDETPETRSFSCDLELTVDFSRRATFRKSAIVGLGLPVRSVDGWIMPIEWHAASLAPLFPIFAGQLRLGPDLIELDGHYAPPGGAVGYLLDRTLLRIAARETGRWFLLKIVSILESTPAGDGVGGRS